MLVTVKNMGSGVCVLGFQTSLHGSNCDQPLWASVLLPAKQGQWEHLHQWFWGLTSNSRTLLHTGPGLVTAQKCHFYHSPTCAHCPWTHSAFVPWRSVLTVLGWDRPTAYSLVWWNPQPSQGSSHSDRQANHDLDTLACTALAGCWRFLCYTNIDIQDSHAWPCLLHG